MNQAKFDIFMRKLRGNGEQIWKWRQRDSPQDSPLGDNPEVGNPDTISYQDYPPQL